MQNSSDHHFCEASDGARICLSVIYSLLSVSGTLSNLLVIYLAYAFKKLRTTSNAFIINGCVADLLACALWMPQEALLIAQRISVSHIYMACTEGLLFLWITVSLVSHSLIAVNRYILITKAPTTYQAVYQKRHTECMISLSWVIPSAVMVPWLVAQSSTEIYPKCVPLKHTDVLRRDTVVYSSYTTVFTIFTQTIIILYCYFKIFRKVQVSVKRVSVLNFQIINNLPYSLPRKDKRLRGYVLAVCWVFLLTTQPVMWVVFVGFFRSVPEALVTVSWLFFSLLMVFNPFLYTWKNEEFRKSFKALLKGDAWKNSAIGVEPGLHTISQNVSWSAREQQ
ncbi:probable G-protein coupled receptor 88 [Protopterus annectens]|uniref:probable G-protein coupled receptor 88 n=1 Tax=Protopterus annectens TaxID=7888 RepID=UPI001CFA08F1|nr:probable G-protein coupled receptor 88 [Protopterus annectens]